MLTIEVGPNNWEVIQQKNGKADVFIVGRYVIKENFKKLIVKVFDESTDESITSWMDAKMNRGEWKIDFEIPVGGPYRIEIRWSNPQTWLSRGDCAGMIHHVCVGDVFVIAGQSNSIGTGHGELLEEPEFGVHLFRDCKYWDIATNPLNSERGYHSPFLSFAKRLKKRLNYPIGLIPCAVGGSQLSKWISQEDGILYNEMMSVIKNRKIKGVVWYQGESEAMECNSQNYLERFSLFVENLRKDLRDELLPIFTVQLNRHTDDFDNSDEMDIHYDAVREAQRRAAHSLRNVYIIPSIDAGRLSDGIHNSKSANFLIGERLARLVLFKIYNIGIDPSAPNVESIKKIDSKNIKICFSGVEDTLMAYHVRKKENFPILIEDERGVNDIEKFEIVKNTIYIKLNREIVGKSFVKCQYGKNPRNYIQDFGKQIAVLCFSNVEVIV